MALGSAFYFSARIDELLYPDLRAVVERFGDAASAGIPEPAEVVTTRSARSICFTSAMYTVISSRPRKIVRMGCAISAAESPVVAT